MTEGENEPANPANPLEEWREPPGWLGEYVRRVKRYVQARNGAEPAEAAPSG